MIANITTQSSLIYYTAFNAHLTWCIQSVLTQDINEYIVLLGVACGYQGKEKEGEVMTTSQASDISPISVIGLVFAIGNLNLPTLTLFFMYCLLVSIFKGS